MMQRWGVSFFAEAFVVIEKGERGPTSWLQSDKRTHTVPHARTPPPRLGRERDEICESNAVKC